MKNLIKLCAVGVLMLVGCGSDDDGGSNGPNIMQEEITATYRLTFTSNFTAETHPNDFPGNPTFGPILGVAHTVNNDLFTVGQVASEEFADYMATSNLTNLVQSISPTDADDSADVFAVSIAQGGEIGGVASTSVDVTITPTSGNISFLARINPSPDWFVGVDSFFLLGDDGVLIEDTTIDLFPIDAGIQGGQTYLAEPEPTSQTIQPISGFPFSVGVGVGLVSPLGTLRIERIN